VAISLHSAVGFVDRVTLSFEFCASSSYVV